MADRQMYYRLEGHEAVPCTLMEWERWFEDADRIVEVTMLADDVCVSTVFLGLDHNWREGPPDIFETMIFGGPLDHEQARYTTWDEAEIGHKLMVARARAEQ
jgi:hypothetical protein